MAKKPYNFRGHKFIYDHDNCEVKWVTKATQEDYEAVIRLPHIYEIIDGWSVLDSVGLSKENWKNREARDGYLGMWIDEIEEECRYILKTEFSDLF